MPRINKKPFEFAKLLQVFHGFDIRVLRQSAPGGHVVWSVQVADTGLSFKGTSAQMMAFLQGYQGGYIAGRKYTRIEQDGLKNLIREVETRFKVA